MTDKRKCEVLEQIQKAETNGEKWNLFEDLFLEIEREVLDILDLSEMRIQN